MRAVSFFGPGEDETGEGARAAAASGADGGTGADVAGINGAGATAPAGGLAPEGVGVLGGKMGGGETGLEGAGGRGV